LWSKYICGPVPSAIGSLIAFDGSSFLSGITNGIGEDGIANDSLKELRNDQAADLIRFELRTVEYEPDVKCSV
jgi:hypothetical protein